MQSVAWVQKQKKKAQFFLFSFAISSPEIKTIFSAAVS
jgi:hypothetical protein